MIDWIPIVFVTFKVLVFGVGMFFAIKWHYDQGKKEKRAVLGAGSKVAAVFVLSPGLGNRHLRPCQHARFGLDLPMMAKNSQPISSHAAAIPRCGYWSLAVARITRDPSPETEAGTCVAAP